MKRAWVLVVVVLAAALLATPAVAQTKWVRGPVTAMAGDSITVTVKGTATTFKVEQATRVIAPGAGTATRAYETGTGKPAPKLGDFVKVGQHVEVHYNVVGGANVATEIRPIAVSEEAASEETTASTVTGTIASLAADSLLVKVDGKEMKFAVTPKTRVTGSGLGTKARELAAAGKPMPITEFLKVNDRVAVYYNEGPIPTATGVRLVQRALK
jgi:hypothetical protein